MCWAPSLGAPPAARAPPAAAPSQAGGAEAAPKRPAGALCVRVLEHGFAAGKTRHLFSAAGVAEVRAADVLRVVDPATLPPEVDGDGDDCAAVGDDAPADTPAAAPLPLLVDLFAGQGAAVAAGHARARARRHRARRRGARLARGPRRAASHALPAARCGRRGDDTVDVAHATARGRRLPPADGAPPACLEEMRFFRPSAGALEALASGTWSRLRRLDINFPPAPFPRFVLDAPFARALAAALRRMPALRELNLFDVPLLPGPAIELFGPFSDAGAAPLLRALAIEAFDFVPAATRALAATGWRLEDLSRDLGMDEIAALDAAGVTALVAAPTFAIRHLNLAACGLDAAALLALANARWPLEELDLAGNTFDAAADGPALAALSRHANLRKLSLDRCWLSAAGSARPCRTSRQDKALVEATWPGLTSLKASWADVARDGPHALGAAAFAGFPALEDLVLYGVRLGEAGAALLASRRWPRLKVLGLCSCALGDAGLAALARGAWPALECLDVRWNNLRAPPNLEDARRWAPALVELLR